MENIVFNSVNIVFGSSNVVMSVPPSVLYNVFYIMDGITNNMGYTLKNPIITNIIMENV
jgi:hypothetical protein